MENFYIENSWKHALQFTCIMLALIPIDIGPFFTSQAAISEKITFVRLVHDEQTFNKSTYSIAAYKNHTATAR